MNDHELAARLATRAGDLLLDVRADFADAPAQDRKAAGDKQSHDFLMAELARQRPGDAVLSEEGVDDPARLDAERVWIVTRSTAHASSPNSAARTGPCTWRCGKRGSWSRGRSRCPRRT